MRLLLSCLACIALAACAGPDRVIQTITPQASGMSASLRGVSAVSAAVAWASGSGGTVLRTTDGGATWTTVPVRSADDLDFRDVHAVDADTAWIVSAGLPARIYRTDDGGDTWTLQYERLDEGVFFDAIEFFDARRGLAFSDPVGGHLLIVRTSDGGATWTEVDVAGIPTALSGEAGFAASGTCMTTFGAEHAWIGLGGVESPGARVFRSDDGGATWSVAATPMTGGPSSGIFSIAFRDERNGVAVGGNYLEPERGEGTAMVTSDGGVTWTIVAEAPPRGYRSVVRWAPGFSTPVAVAAGPSGTDCSTDGGRTWRPLGESGYHAMSLVPGEPIGWAVGAEGRISFIRLHD